MKSINNNENINNNNHNMSTDSNNWLCFSLSPNMKMESHSHQNQNQNQNHHQSSSSSSTTTTTTSFFNASTHQQLSDYGLDFGSVEGYSSLSTMPLKSDGSLCLMEALSRSQPHQAMVTSGSSSTPKLEDFFGSATMVTHHHYEGSDKEAIALSLDNMFYQTPQHYSHFSGHEEIMGLEQPKEAHLGGFVGSMGYGDLRSLSLSMSPGSQSSCITASQQISPTVTECGVVLETKKRGPENVDHKKIVHRKSLDTFGQRTSQFRGVTRHRWTGRYEAHLWDNSCKKEGQSRKGRQVYLGGYDMEEKAARAYDLAALKYWGPTTHINFPLENYEKEQEEMKNRTRQEYVAHLRRKSSGFSRGASMYRGVTRHHQHGRWQARIGRVAGNKDLYLGTFSTQEEAAEAYDVAAIKFRGLNAVTNFDITRYDVDRIMTSNTLLAREFAKRKTEAGPSITDDSNLNLIATNELENNGNESEWKMALYNSSQQQQQQLKSDQNKTLNNSFEPFSVSNASSLVTSLSSSREGSPQDHSVPALFGMPPLVSKFFANPTNSADPWVPPNTQLRPSISIPHMPIFAAWSDM